MKTQIKKLVKFHQIKKQNPNAFVKYLHGISADETIDRMIVTETVSPTLEDPETTISIIEYSTGKVLPNIELLQDENIPCSSRSTISSNKTHCIRLWNV